MATSRLRPLVGGIALGITLVLVTAGNALATSDSEVPEAPGNLRVVERTLTTISLEWDAVADIDLYRVVHDEGSVNTADNRLRLWNLTPDTAFQIRVHAIDAGNVSPASNEVATSTLADTQPPTTPEDFRVTSQNSTAVWLAWSYALDDDQGMSELDYLIDDGTTIHTVHVKNSITITGLPTNQTHTFTIQARDRSGNLSGTEQVSTLIENTPPSVPSNLRQIGTEGGQAVFGWDASTDNSGQIRHYIVQFHTGQLHTTDLSVSIADLIFECLLPPDPDDVTFTVRAQDPSGNVSATASITLPVV